MDQGLWLVVSRFAYDPGVRLAGLGLTALGLWLLRYDIARRSVHQKGLTRYIAACLLPGYAWLLLGGLLWMIYGGEAPASPHYDAMLHGVFVGVVISVIFDHALVIIPPVMGVQLHYTPLFCLPLGLPYLSLLLRIAGDLILWLPLRQWGGLLNEVAIFLFLFLVVLSTLSEECSWFGITAMVNAGQLRCVQTGSNLLRLGLSCKAKPAAGGKRCEPGGGAGDHLWT